MDAVVYKGFRFHSCVHTNHDGSAVRGEVSIARHDEPPTSAIELSGAEAGAELDTRLRSSHPRRLARLTRGIRS